MFGDGIQPGQIPFIAEVDHFSAEKMRRLFFGCFGTSKRPLWQWIQVIDSSAR